MTVEKRELIKEMLQDRLHEAAYGVTADHPGMGEDAECYTLTVTVAVRKDEVDGEEED